MRMSRRLFLTGAAAILSAASRPAASEPGAGPAAVPLWPGDPPGGGGPSGPLVVGSAGWLRNIRHPFLEMHRAPDPGGGAMLVVPGGSLAQVEMKREGQAAARWLNARGMTAFILAYRLPGERWGAGALAPLQDAQRALRLIRSRAAEFGVDGERLGVIGFSAGGHVAGMAAARSDFRAYEPVDDVDALSARPRDAALVYPVVSCAPQIGHARSCGILLGSGATAETRRAQSVDAYVTAGAPPFFLVHADNDPVVSVMNSVVLATACAEAGVPVTFERLSRGGHGFAMGQSSTPRPDWPERYADWLRRTGVLR